jgi:hypothetical protein
MKINEAIKFLDEHPLYEMSDIVKEKIDITEKQWNKWNKKSIEEEEEVKPKKEKTKPKKEEDSPDYDGYELFIKDYLDSRLTEQLKAISEGSKKYKLTKTEAGNILKRLVQEKKEQDEIERQKEIQEERKARQEEKPKELTAIDILNQEKLEEEIENLKENEINWIEDPYWINAGWDGLKGKMKKIWGHKQKYSDKKHKWFLLAHSGDVMVGKPQLVFPSLQRIPLFKQAVLKQDEKDEDGNKTDESIEIQSFYAFDENFDKRHDGFQKDAFAMDFWMYKIKTKDGKEVFIWSQKELPNCSCEFKGMMVELEDMTELSRNMKVKSIGRIFFLKEFEPDIKILTKEQLVKYTKEREITEEDWLNFMATHPLGTMNRFPKDTELLKSAWLLSGKFDGYPLHLFVWGPAGSRKSMGYVETTASKFEGDDFK